MKEAVAVRIPGPLRWRLWLAALTAPPLAACDGGERCGRFVSAPLVAGWRTTVCEDVEVRLVQGQRRLRWHAGRSGDASCSFSEGDEASAGVGRFGSYADDDFGVVSAARGVLRDGGRTLAYRCEVHLNDLGFQTPWMAGRRYEAVVEGWLAEATVTAEGR